MTQNVSMNLQFCSMMMQRPCQLTQEAGQSFRKMHSQHFSHWSGYLQSLALPHKYRAQFQCQHNSWISWLPRHMKLSFRDVSLIFFSHYSFTLTAKFPSLGHLTVFSQCLKMVV